MAHADRMGHRNVLQLPSGSRAERVVAAGRLVLAAFTLLAIWLDPSQPSKYAHATYLLMLGYVGYAAALVAVVWLSRAPLNRLGIVTHAADLAIFCVFMYLTEGPGSPFFSYFLFSLAAATLRWQWRGAVWTALAAIVAFNVMGLYANRILHDPEFELNRFIIRSVYLFVMATLLGYLGAYEMRQRTELSELASWPRVVPSELGALLRSDLGHASQVLRAPRVLLVWDDPDEACLRLALWFHDDVGSWTEPAGSYQPWLAEPLEDVACFATDCGAARPVVWFAGTSGLSSWRGAPVHPALQARFAIGAMASVRLRGELVRGRLFSLDRRRMTSDDLVLGAIVARHVAAALDHFYLSRRLRRAAASEERVRLSRDLHDGVLQSLTGAALRLHTVERLIDRQPESARAMLSEVRDLIAEEQRDLRFYIQDLKPNGLGALDDGAGFEESLRDLTRRLESVWNLRVDLRVASLPPTGVPGVLLRELYRLIQEASVNAARHAKASEVTVTVGAQNGHVDLVVADNGHGFPFKGTFDAETVAAQRLGPRTLSERIAALGGSLALASAESGSRLEIRVPLPAG